MKKLKFFPILAWMFLVYGLIMPIEPRWLLMLWWLNAVLTPGLHLIELYWAIPIGKKAGYSVGTSIFMTLLLGATWWKPLTLKIVR